MTELLEREAEFLAAFEENYTAFHLPGQHNQKDHAGGGHGWSADSAELPTDMEPGLQKQVRKTLDSLSQDYSLPVKEVWWGAEKFRETAAGYSDDRHPNRIYINKDWQDSPSVMEVGVRSAGGIAQNVGDVITHEYGHLLHFDMDAKHSTGMDALATRMAHAADINGFPRARRDAVAASISAYADASPHETVAEGFLAYRKGGKRRPAHEYLNQDAPYDEKAAGQVADNWVQDIGQTFDRFEGGGTPDALDLLGGAAFHLPGQHDQSTHAGGVRAGGWDPGEASMPDDMKQDLRDEVHAALGELAESYTLPITDIKWAEPQYEDGNSMAYTYSDGSHPGTIFVSKMWQDQRDTVESMLKLETGVPRNLGDVLTHEYGHLLDGQMDLEHSRAKQKLFDRMQGEVDDAGITTPFVAAHISAYAVESPAEMVGEAFCSYRNKGRRVPQEVDPFGGELAPGQQVSIDDIGAANAVADEWVNHIGSTFDKYYGAHSTTASAFHLPGQHNQATHGHGAGAGGPEGQTWTPKDTAMPAGMSPGLANEVRGALGGLADDYTVPVNEIKWGDAQYAGNYSAYTFHSDLHTIYLNRQWQNNREQINREVATSGNVTKNLDDVITHEYGHLLTYEMDLNHSTGIKSMERRMADSAHAAELSTRQVASAVSGYAASDGYEGIAETFTAYRKGGQRSPAREWLGNESVPEGLKFDMDKAEQVADGWVQDIGSTFDRYLGTQATTGSAFHLPGQHNQLDHAGGRSKTPKAGKPGTGEHEAPPGSGTALGSPWNGSDVTVPTDMNNEVHGEVTDALNKLSADYTHEVRFIGWNEPGNEGAGAYTYPQAQPNTIYISKDWQDNPAKIRKDYASGTTVARNLGDCITHEYGHLLDFQLSGEHPEAWKKMTNKMVRESRNAGLPGKGQLAAAGLSAYAASDPTEALAEGFLSYRTHRLSTFAKGVESEQPQMKAAARGWAKTIGETYNEYFGVKTYEQEPLPTASAAFHLLGQHDQKTHGHQVAEWSAAATAMPSDMSAPLADEVRGVLGDLAHDYSVPVNKIKFSDMQYEGKAAAYTLGNEPHSIYLSRMFDFDRKLIDGELADNGALSKNLHDVITHEYGHLLAFNTQIEHERDFEKMVKRIDKSSRKAGLLPQTAAAGLSQYATTNGAEAVAEAFLAHRKGGHREPIPRKYIDNPNFDMDKAEQVSAGWVDDVGSTFDGFYGTGSSTASAWYRPPERWDEGTVEVFHLPGQHDQSTHAGGRGFGPRAAKAVTDGKLEQQTHVTPTGAAKAALHDYGRPETEFGAAEVPHYVRTNSALRTARGDLTPGAHHPEAIRVTNGLDDVFARHAAALPQDALVTRGVRNMNLTFGGQEPKVGMTWRDHGYSSTTANVETDPSRFLGAGGANMRILIPKGTKAVSNPEHIDKGEILLPRGSTFRVARDNGTDANGIRQLDVEVIPR